MILTVSRKMAKILTVSGKSNTPLTASISPSSANEKYSNLIGW